jgi:hypothetical protein
MAREPGEGWNASSYAGPLHDLHRPPGKYLPTERVPPPTLSAGRAPGNTTQFPGGTLGNVISTYQRTLYFDPRRRLSRDWLANDATRSSSATLVLSRSFAPALMFACHSLRLPSHLPYHLLHGPTAYPVKTDIFNCLCPGHLQCSLHSK